MSDETDKLERENLALWNLLGRARDVLRGIFCDVGLRPGAVDCYKDIEAAFHRNTEAQNSKGV